jgi:hypothetical protein
MRLPRRTPVVAAGLAALVAAFPGPANPASASPAYGVNDHGEIVGVYFANHGVCHGFIDIAGRFTTFDEPDAGTGGMSTVPVNDSSVIVGTYFDVSGTAHGFERTPGR